MKTLIVEVSAEDIARGKPDSSVSCPIALALTRKLGSLAFVQVDCDTTCAGAVVFTNSKRMCKFIEDFDGRKTVKPSRFRMIPF